MKKVKLYLVVVLFTAIATQNTQAQINNWSRVDSAKNIARIYGGLDFGITYGLHYGRVIKTKNITWVPFADISFPSGKNAIDDYRCKVGTAAKLFQYKSWIASLDIAIVNRQNSNPFVTMQSLGALSGFQVGYYKLKWFANISFATDNSLLTHLKHSEAYKGNYAQVKDGWYDNTANNQLLSLNTGYSFNKTDITLSLGVLTSDEFKSMPNLPVYVNIGINHRF